MILVVSLNPALDLTYQVDASTGRGSTGRRRARQARRQGRERGQDAAGAGQQTCGWSAWSGGTGRERWSDRPCRQDIPAVFTDDRRRDPADVHGGGSEPGQTALFNEPGPLVTAGEYAAVCRPRTRRHWATLGGGAVREPAARRAGRCVRGADHDGRPRGVPAISGHQRAGARLAVAAGPTMVKPNLAELESRGRARRAVDTARDPLAATGWSSRRPAEARGWRPWRRRPWSWSRSARRAARGDRRRRLAGHARAGRWKPDWGRGRGGCRARRRAGAGPPWPDLLRHAAALGAAAVAAPVAGEFARLTTTRPWPACRSTFWERCSCRGDGRRDRRRGSGGRRGGGRVQRDRDRACRGDRGRAPRRPARR